MTSAIHREFSSISVQWILSDPFWGHLLSGIPKKVVSTGPCLAWGTEDHGIPILQLHVNGKKWEKIDAIQEKKTLLLHELLHLVLNHPFETDQFHYPHLYDVVCDWIAYSFQPSSPLPPSIPRAGSFGIPAGYLNAGIRSYYDNLESLWLEGLRTSAPQPTLEMLEQYKETEHRHKHSTWHQELSNLSKAEKDIIKASMDHLILNTLDRVGQAAIQDWPAALRLRLEKLGVNTSPKVDWRRVLRLFVGRHKKTQIKNTIRRPSKRYGTSPGIQIQQKQKILVVIDTSASIQESQFNDFFSEVHHLWRLGIAIHIVESDTQIRKTYPYQGQTPAYISGRGGSSFDAAIRWANESHQPDAILYFTDGDAPPLKLKSRFPILWLVHESKSVHWQQDQGSRIVLPRHHSQQ